MLSQNDKRLSQILITKQLMSKPQLQKILQKPNVQQALEKGVSLLALLKKLEYLSPAEIKLLLAQYIVVQCSQCQEKSKIIGPEVPEGFHCEKCKGSLQKITEAPAVTKIISKTRLEPVSPNPEKRKKRRNRA
jgi:hypothetical protein